MKTSNKILWGSFSGLFATAVVFLIVMRIFLPGDVEPSGETAADTAHDSKVIAMSGFTGLDLKGHWRAEVVQGPKEAIVVKGPANLLSALSATRSVDSLALHMAEQRGDSRKLQATITMPVLQTLRVKGAVDMRLSGFDMERLSVRVEGVTSIIGKEGRIGEFILRGKGVSRLNLKDIPVWKADVRCTGVIKIDLTMAGGELTGSIKGVGELRYAGETSHISIQQKGTCKVVHDART